MAPCDCFTIFGFPSGPTKVDEVSFTAVAMHICITEEMVRITIIFLLF
jgi:hypothetical protein